MSSPITPEVQKLAYLQATTRIAEARQVLSAADEELTRGNYRVAVRLLDKVAVLTSSATKQAVLLEQASNLPLSS